MAHLIHFTGDIRIQTMSGQSGLFIGERNNALGWSSHRKVNTIFGAISGHSNMVFRNFSFLNDPDNIDTPIDDRDVHVSIDHQGNENLMSVSLDSVNVASMTQNSNLFLGKGTVTGIDGNQKQNNAQGNTYGNMNGLIHNLNWNTDSDLVDGIINDQDIKIARMQRKE